MTSQELRKKIWLNSISNYLRTALRMVLGLLMYRVLYPKPGEPGLSMEEFGFYNTLWSIFGYGILMDFGFGLAAQKKVAEYSVTQDWEKMSRVLSTIFYFYFLNAAAIILGVLGCSHWMMALVKLQHPESSELFRQVLVIFLCFIGLSFPVGISVEILYGQQRIALANNLASVGAVANFVLVLAALHQGHGLMAVVVIGLICSLVPSVVGGYLGLLSLHKVKLRPKYFSWGVLRETLRFSMFAYVGMVTQLIMASTDRLILSMTISFAAVTIYETGARILSIFNAFALQLPETISPAAAHLHSKGDRAELQRLLVDGTRFNVMLATPIYLLSAFFMEGAMSLLTKGQKPSPEMYWTGQVLMLWGYSTIITHSISKKIFMMCDGEKRLVVLSTVEAVANLVLSVFLVVYFEKVVCVAIGSLIPTLIIGWFFLWPWAASHAGVSGWGLAGKVLYRNWLAALPVIIFCLVCRTVPALDFRGNTLVFILEAGVASILAAMSLWQWGLTLEEKEKASHQIRQRFNKRKPA